MYCVYVRKMLALKELLKLEVFNVIIPKILLSQSIVGAF